MIRAAQSIAALRGSAVRLIRPLLGYGLVSATALAVDFACYVTALRFISVAALASGVGYIAGVITHYALSSRLVFKDRITKRGVTEEMPVLIKFFAAGATGLVITTLIVGVLADVMGFNPILAKFVAAGTSFVAVFLSLNFLVFAQARTTEL